MNDISEIFKKIFLEPESLNFIRFEIGKSLLCSDINNCHFLYLVGKGGAGKSTLIKYLFTCLTNVYCHRIPSDTFLESKRAQVIMSKLEPQTRFLFLEDPPNKPMASSILKTVCDGLINCRPLFQNGSIEVKVNAKLMMTSNNILSFDDNDTGIRRRILYYECKSKFTNNPAEVNNVNVFPDLGTGILENLNALDKSALILYFTEFCKHANENIAIPTFFMSGDYVRSFRSFASELLVEKLGSFICFDDMVKMISKYFPLFEFTKVEVLKEFKDIPVSVLSIIFEPTRRINNRVGLFINVSVNEINYAKLMNNEPLIRADGSLSPMFIM